jgi:hypothetical protein
VHEDDAAAAGKDMDVVGAVVLGDDKEGEGDRDEDEDDTNEAEGR